MKVFICLLAIAALSNAELRPKDLSAPVYNLPSDFGSRIVGGQEVVPHSVPYQAALFIDTPQGQFFCGGSLISKNYVLTAAHCCDAASSVEVILGAHKVRDQGEPTQVRITVPKENIHVHEKWNSQRLSNDLTLLKLPTPVELNENIQTVQLIDSDETLAGVTETTTGWGKDKDSASGISPVLRTVSTKIMKNSECSQSFGDVITANIICGNGEGGKSSCNGDSGGPMVIGEGDKRQQVGIVSFGSAFGCEIGYPHAYTRVSKYLDWIKKNSDLAY